jgi:uncharacterized protein (TIGR03545 family)
MTKWIRWWGLGAFLVVVAVIGFLWIVFVDGWVKRLIEDVGTEVVGAKVDLDHADLSLFPAGLTLTRLQVTNPKDPMTNAVEVARIAMGLDGLNMLQRKVIVEEMSVEGVRLGTPRTISGAVKPVKKTPTDEKSLFGISLPSLEVPDIKTVLQNEDLETMRLIEELKTDLKQEKTAWEARLQDLPGKAQVAKYQERVKQLKAATKGGLEGILGGVGEVQSLKEEIDGDVQALKGARKEFDEKVALLKKRLEQIKTAPQRDVQRLQAKYNLSPQGLANMSQTLLGSQIGSWVRQGVAWYERAKPFLEGAQAMRGSKAGPEVQKPLRGKGVDVHFTEEQPLPDFLVRLARVSLNLDVGNLEGTIHNVTSDQPTLGKPLTFAFAGEQLKGVHALALEGTLNHIVPAQSRDQLTLKAKGYELDGIALSKDDKWPVMLKRGLGDITVDATLQGRALTAQGSGHLRALQLGAGAAGDANPLTRSLSSAVSGISQMSLKANVAGTLDNYDVEVSSDLDRILQDAAGKMVNELAASFGGELQAAISAKIAEPMAQLQETLGGLNAIGGDLGDRFAQHNEVLNSLVEKSLPSKRLKKLPGGLKLPF